MPTEKLWKLGNLRYPLIQLRFLKRTPSTFPQKFKPGRPRDRPSDRIGSRYHSHCERYQSVAVVFLVVVRVQHFMFQTVINPSFKQKVFPRVWHPPLKRQMLMPCIEHDQLIAVLKFR